MLNLLLIVAIILAVSYALAKTGFFLLRRIAKHHSLALKTVQDMQSSGIATACLIGLAAKPLFGNLLAGLQIAFTQPIRLNDVVIVEGEWGVIEEILSTYVVVRIWDDRRLVMPLRWFIDHPFQNWTRSSSNITGSII